PSGRARHARNREGDRLVHTSMPGIQTMRESVTYQAILAEGRAEGIVTGALRGIVKGVCHSLLVLGTEKFGEPTAEIKTHLESIDDLYRLDQLLMRMLTAKSWEELLELPKRPRKIRKKS